MAQKILATTARFLAHKLPSKALQSSLSFMRLGPQTHIQRCLVNQSAQITVQKDESHLLLSEKDKEDFFRLNDLFTVEDLFNARVHFGHKERLLHKEMRPYIFGKRLGVLILDLDITAKLLNKALNVTADIAYRGGIILFIHSSRQSAYLVENAAKECGEYAHCRKWRNEVFTDSTKAFGAITRLPDLLVFFSSFDLFGNYGEHRAVTMASKMLIPTISICDTNTDPTIITYPVPGNDDSPQSIELYSHLFKTAVLKGKEKRKEIIEKYGDEFYNKSLEAV